MHTQWLAETGYSYELVWKYCEKRKVFRLALKDDRVEQCLRSCGSEFQMWDPKQGKVRKPRVLRLYCWIFSMRVSEEERSARDISLRNRSAFRLWLKELSSSYMFSEPGNGGSEEWGGAGLALIVSGTVLFFFFFFWKTTTVYSVFKHMDIHQLNYVLLQ